MQCGHRGKVRISASLYSADVKTVASASTPVLRLASGRVLIQDIVRAGFVGHSRKVFDLT